MTIDATTFAKPFSGAPQDVPGPDLRRAPVIRHRSRSLDPAEMVDALIAGKLDPSAVTFRQELTIRRYCRERANASAAEIQDLCNRGHFKNARRARASHLRNRAVLLNALFHSVRKKWPHRLTASPEQREKMRTRRITAVFAQFSNVGKFNRCARATQFAVPKSNGGFRTITSFNWLDYARQLVLKSALTPFANLHVSQFMLAHDSDRRGPAAVREALLGALNACDDECVFIQFDVVNFYGSISQEWLESNLGIDPLVIRRNLHTGGMHFDISRVPVTVHVHHEATTERGRRGIPQGSAVSPLIAEQVIASVLRSAAVFEAFPLFTWSDNVGMIVPRREADQTVELVRAAFADHGAGPFQLTISRYRVSAEFKFLGVWYRKSSEGPVAFIPEEVLTTWEGSIFERLDMSDGTNLEDVERHVRSKYAQWCWFDDAREAHERLMEHIQSLRELHDDGRTGEAR